MSLYLSAYYQSRKSSILDSIVNKRKKYILYICLRILWKKSPKRSCLFRSFIWLKIKGVDVDSSFEFFFKSTWKETFFKCYSLTTRTVEDLPSNDAVFCFKKKKRSQSWIKHLENFLLRKTRLINGVFFPLSVSEQIWLVKWSPIDVIA